MFKYLIFLIIPLYSFSQLENEKDNYYLEDQLYLGLSYNVWRNMPTTISQSGFSNSISIGFIKDIPLNSSKNIGFGIGLGYAHDTYFHNLKISKVNDNIVYSNFDIDDNYKNNKFITNSFEIPFEFRIRTSTKDSYKFWRVYPGLKYSYIFNSRASFELNGKQKIKSPRGINTSQLGLTLGVGYGTWNGYLYYGLNNLFNDVNYNNSDELEIQILKIGLQFYIL